MRVAIQTLGSRGDVQPYIALARALLDRGHAVQVAAPQQFEAFAAERRVPFAALPGEFLALLDTPDGKAAFGGREGLGAGLRLLKAIRPLLLRLLDAEWDAIRTFGPDVIVYHPKSLASVPIAAKLGRPCILAAPLPGFTPTRSFPTPLSPLKSLGPLNRASHRLTSHGATLLFGRILRAWRASTLGLPDQAKTQPDATLYAYSPTVVPVPPDWPAHVRVTGYWFLDHPDWRPPEMLQSFLDAGPPPIYVGFGSMPGLDAKHMARAAIDALERAGRRGLLAVGGGALEPDAVPATVHVLKTAPHDWLMPRMHAAIHHGGAGTTAAALRAGIPMAICPFFGDQPFWARRMFELGVAPPALDRKALSAQTLSAAMDDVAKPGMRARALELGKRIADEDGVGNAVRFIEEHLEATRGRQAGNMPRVAG